jgi:hypothetical protein
MWSERKNRFLTTWWMILSLDDNILVNLVVDKVYTGYILCLGGE